MATTLKVLNIEGDAAVTLGRGAAAPGDNAIAIGAAEGSPVEGEVTTGAFASGDRSVAVGQAAVASGAYAVAVGSAAVASGASAVAIGVGAQATAANAVQLGSGVNATPSSVQFMGLRLPTATQYNALVTFLGDALRVSGALARSATAEKFKTTATAYYTVGGATFTKAATDNLTFSLAHVVTALKWGAILVQINAAGTVSTKVVSATQAYNTSALAIAALPAADAGNAVLGYITINADSGDWTANTDDMTNGSDLTAATFVNATPPVLPSAF